MTPEDLRVVRILSGLSDERLRWLAERGEEIYLEPGDWLFREHDRPEKFYVQLDGQLEAGGEVDGVWTAVTSHEPGGFLGAVPLLTRVTFDASGRAVLPTRLVAFDRETFRTLLYEEPEVERQVFAAFAPLFRTIESFVSRRERLAALGRLSAGLAHELNNPAAAASRAAADLGDALERLSSALARVAETALEPGAVAELSLLGRDAVTRASDAAPLDPLDAADREDALAVRLAELGASRAREAAPMLVRAGVEADELAASVPAGEALDAAVDWLAALVTVSGLAADVEESASRISELVGAVKEYTHMDAAPRSDVDVNKGIERTLTMLGHKLKHGVRLERDYDRALPRIAGNPGELNQVWTNLLDNAIDAAGASGTVRVATSARGGDVVVEVADDGPGIPPDVLPRIFDPFFTTKEVGEGTGLGLEVSSRIVEAHGGRITVESKPGDTRFCVRLPV